MTPIREISKTNTIINNIPANKFQTPSISSVFPDKGDKSSDSPKTILDVKTKENVANYTGLDVSLVEKIMEFEGAKFEEYKDIAGIRTIGYGHNIDHDPNYKYGKKITEKQAFKLLAADLQKAQDDIKNCIGDVELTKGQNEALTELFFNVGVENLQNTNLIKLIKDKKFEDAVAEFNFICTTDKTKANSSLCKRRIYDIEKFSTNNHSQKGLNTMQMIMDKGIIDLDQKIKTAGILDKPFFISAKNSYINETKQTINKAKEEFEKEQARKKDLETLKKITPVFEPIPTQKLQLILKLK